MASNNNNTNLENPLSNAPQSIRWEQTLELGYDEPEAPPTVCFGCGRPPAGGKLSTCSKCKVAAYCSRDCQVADWKQGKHKLACPSYARLGKLGDTTTACVPADDDSGSGRTEPERGFTELVRNEVFARIRFYACPYAVYKTLELGKGFLFVQSDTTLKDLSIAIPKDRCGHPMNTRSILMHFLTIGEYDAEVCRDDFEMAVVRDKLQQLTNDYDDEKEVVLLVRLRCGHVALGKAVLVPDYRICKKLGADYYANNPAGAVQLTLDDL